MELYRELMNTLCKRILILNIQCGFLLVTISTMLGMSEGFESYMLEISTFASSLTDLVYYLLLLMIYALGIEYILRSAQKMITHKWGQYLGMSGAALMYGLSHLRHGWIALLYALSIGMITAYAYERWRDWKILALWHIQWDLLALGTFLAFALCNISPYAQAINYHYKQQLMHEGRIVYRPQVGWIDTAHYWGAQRRACEIYSHLKQGHTQINIKGLYKDVFGGVITHYFHLNLSHVDMDDIELVAQESTLTLAYQDEAYQAQADLWTGLRLSAWNAEDIRSVKAALSDMSDQFFSLECQKRSGPLPQDFIPPYTQTDPNLWPAFRVFVESGLP